MFASHLVAVRACQKVSKAKIQYKRLEISTTMRKPTTDQMPLAMSFKPKVRWLGAVVRPMTVDSVTRRPVMPRNKVRSRVELHDAMPTPRAGWPAKAVLKLTILR
jgi:hypothetical protein